MQSKKINELGTNVSPSVNDLTVVGDAATGQLKKITLNQIASLFGGTGTVSSVAMTVPTGLTVTGSPITTSGTLAVTLTAGYSIPTTAKQTEWDAGYAERLKWDGGASGLSAPTARTSLGLVIGTDVLAYRTFGTAANNNTGDFATAAQGVNADTAYTNRITGASLPLSISSNVISIAQSSSTISGFLSSTDWNTFNDKQQALNGTGFVKATGTTITYDNSTYLTTGNAASTYLTISNASSTYLPLAGGTLTGNLNGTSAIFTSSVTAGSFSARGSIAGYNIFRRDTDTYVGGWYSASGSILLDLVGVGTALTIASTGAATFSSSVTIPSAVNSGYFIMSESGNSNSRTWRIASDGNGFGDWALQQSTTFGGSTFANKLTVASSGAATFSSSVTATSFTVSDVIINSNQIYRNGSSEFYVNYSGTGHTLLGNGTGNVGINAGTNPSFRLQVGGTLGVSGASTFSGLVTNYNVYNTQTASYTLVLSDASKIIEMNVASSPNTVTVPTNASVAFPIGTEITIMQYSDGVTTIAAASGVTIVSKDNARIIANRYTGATLVKRGTDEWYLIGNIVV
jgi:hypothetical protein